MDPKLDTTPQGRPSLRIERHLDHPVDRVWQAITTPEHLNHWYPFPVVEMDFRVGGKITFKGMDAVITQLDPPTVFAFSEHAPPEMTRESDDLIHFELTPLEHGCRLVFTHVFDDRPAAASYASGWQLCLDALVARVGDQPFTPTRPSDQAHENFLKAFGLDKGTVEHTPDGWQVSFRRQLTRPVDTVWPALADFADGHTVTENTPNQVLAYQTTTGPVRLELSNGTGHGARLELTHTVSTEQDADPDAWQARIEHLVTRITS